MGCPKAVVGMRGVADRTLIVALLVVVILGGIGLSTYSLLAGGEDRYAVHTEGMHFACGKCKHAFVKDDLTVRQLDVNPAVLRVDCPACRAKGSAIPSVKCMKCGAYFVLASYADPAAKRAGRARDVCPKCGTDRDEWFREHFRRKR